MSSNNPEAGQSNQEVKIGSPESALEQQEKLANSPEKALESPRDRETKAERARTEAMESALSVEAGGKEKQKNGEPSSSKRRGPISRKQRDASFKRQMKEVQSNLPITSRVFSKFIHNKAVEKSSDIVGATVARPNAILAGAVMAFFLTLGVYVTAKIIGYRLSGFETIGAFILGWIIGIVYDYLRVITTGKK